MTEAAVFTCNVQRNNAGRLHLFLPSRTKYKGLPQGEIPVEMHVHVKTSQGTEEWVLSVRKIAINTGWKADADKPGVNALYKCLGAWFGLKPVHKHEGDKHDPTAEDVRQHPRGRKVQFWLTAGKWHMAPLGTVTVLQPRTTSGASVRLRKVG